MLTPSTVFQKPVGQLIVVEALRFRLEWNKFLELITQDKKRMEFLEAFTKQTEDKHSEDVIKNELTADLLDL